MPENKNETVLVTGSSGFIGTHLCAALRSEGYNVRRALRRGVTNDTRYEDVIVGEIGRATKWADALQGVSIVFHLAAAVHIMGRRAGEKSCFDEINVQGTSALADAAKRAGVPRFLFLSSVKVNGECTSGAPFSERDRPAPVDLYGMSKAKAEEAILEMADDRFLVTVVRTPLVYGPGVKANFLALVKAVESGFPIPVSSVPNQRSLIFVENLVSALIAVARAHQVSGVFLVSDGRPVSTKELVESIAKQFGCPPPLLVVPSSFEKALAYVPVVAPRVQRLFGSLTVDDSKIRNALSWQPPIGFNDAIKRTVESLKAERRSERS